MSMAIGIIGLLLGVAILIIFSFMGFAAVPTTMLGAAIVCIFNGINVWTGFSESWIGGLVGVLTAYYILFFASSVFANIMEATGACTSIAYKFLQWFGRKHIMTVICLLAFVLCYGGVSFFVIMFALGPIMEALYSELNIPRKLMILPTAAGCGAWVLAAPGSTQLSNVIPTALGTNLMAAPVLGFIILVVGMACEIWYCEHTYKKEMAIYAQTGEGYQEKPGSKYVLRKEEDCPNAITAFIPIIVLVAMIVIGSFASWFESATFLATLAMCVGCILCLLLNFKFLQGSKLSIIKDLLGRGATGAAGSALALGAIVGFGTVVSGTAAFASLTEWLMGLDLSVYWKGVISTGVLAGVCGSASSGAKLVMQYLGDYFVQSGCNLQILHRLIANASITFDSLPHATGCFLMFAYYGTNHKSAYKYVFMTDTLFPLIITVIATIICSILF